MLTPLKLDELKLLYRRGNKLLFRGKHTETKNLTLAGPDHYFKDLSWGKYRREVDRFFPRSWKIVFKYFIVAKDVFERAKYETVRIVDVGCSKGFLRRVLEGNIKDEKVFYYGIDLDLEKLKDAVFVKDITTGAEGDRVPSVYIHQNATKSIPLKDGSVDLVTCFQMIKYNSKEECNELFKEIFRILKSGGKFYLSTDPVFDGKISLKNLELKKRGYKSFWSKEELEDTLRKIGFKNIEWLGAEAEIGGIKRCLSKEEEMIFSKLTSLLPEEIIESIFGFLHPECTVTKLIIAVR